MTKVLNMYQLKPVIDQSVTVSVPKCMYKMKNIHEQNESINHVQTNSSVLGISDKNQRILPEMAELEGRQKKILEQLEILKSQMLNLRSDLKLCSKSSMKSTESSQLKFQNLKDLEPISLKINPNCIPYYLLAVQKLWDGFIQLIFTIHVHSSVEHLPETNENFSKLLNKTISRAHIPQLHIKIVWKEVECNSELVVSSLRVPIIGETNIIRYLARIATNSEYHLHYEANNNCIQTLIIDNLLDLCYQLSLFNTKTDKQLLLRKINLQLGKSTWLAGTQHLSVADIALYSILNQQNLCIDLNVNMSNWLKRYQVKFDC